MLHNFPVWQKNSLRLLAWTALFFLVWAIFQDRAFAQGNVGAAEVEEPGFLGLLLRSIFLFDSRGLLATLGKPQFYVAAFIAINVIVFVETGLLLGFFLPGDSLLVIAGLICAGQPEWNLPLLLLTVSVSAIVGDSVGYSIGYKSGPKIFNREQSFLFHKDHLIKAQHFYEKHGGKTIILARFMPILRTFAPVVAGVGKMEYRSFLFYNVIGGASWVVSMVLAGYYLPALVNPMFSDSDPTGKQFHVEHHVEKVVIAVVLLSITPMLYAWLKSRLVGKAAITTQEHVAV